MPGATKKRAKEHHQADHGQSNVGFYDGPSDRPGSSAGPPRPSSSRGGPPSNIPAPGPPSNAPGQSARSSSRPRSAAGTPSASGERLRDPARDPAPQSRKTLPSRVDWGGNLYSYYSNEPPSFSFPPSHLLFFSYILHATSYSYFYSYANILDVALELQHQAFHHPSTSSIKPSLLGPIPPRAIFCRTLEAQRVTQLLCWLLPTWWPPL
ncbi:MAG: hypothetical protein L6R40_005598 [Gallowayella cf. fulva]|nr:MAG: hypothetical protein L6R40_005598 [Xanthomendoza cf. fulva]